MVGGLDAGLKLHVLLVFSASFKPTMKPASHLPVIRRRYPHPHNHTKQSRSSRKAHHKVVSRLPKPGGIIPALSPKPRSGNKGCS
jgi:hypothetical protein